MNAAETIRAAIDKLEALQSIRGVTGPTEQDWLWEIDPNVTSPDEDPRVGLVQGGPDVMLHRTIDAQLAILQEELTHVKNARLPLWRESVLDLARAILGESS